MHKTIGWKMDVKNGRGVRGEATSRELHGVLRRFAKITTAKMKKTDADHVLYGIKTYDKMVQSVSTFLYGSHVGRRL